MMQRAFVTLIFFLSAVLLPWYVPVSLGIILIVLWQGYIEAILGGIILDAAFGAPIIALGGFAWLYAALFAGLSLMAFVLRRLMLD